jgi:membrane protein YdbS with pleckstrin-like domain
MLCPSCSTTVPSDSVFCPKCGHRLADPAPAGAKQTPAEKLRGDRGDNNEPERQLWHGSYSPKAMYGQWLLAIVVTLVAIVLCVILPNPITWMAAGVIVPVLWLCIGAFYLYERLSVDYMLTTQRFVHQTGFLRRVINRVEVIDIDDVTVEQGFIERMFGVGTIKLLSSDTSDPKLLLRGIDDVKRVATMIDDCRRDERRKRGMYIETV